jgi:hypothetical protein
MRSLCLRLEAEGMSIEEIRSTTGMKPEFIAELLA